MSTQASFGVKLIMIIVSIIAGVVVFCLIALENVERTKTIYRTQGCGGYTEEVTENNIEIKSSMDLFFGVVAGIAAALFYPPIASLAIDTSEEIKCWAYKGKYERWCPDDRIFLGAFWFITIMYSIVIYTILGIIHRVFD